MSGRQIHELQNMEALGISDRGIFVSRIEILIVERINEHEAVNTFFFQKKKLKKKMPPHLSCIIGPLIIQT